MTGATAEVLAKASRPVLPRNLVRLVATPATVLLGLLVVVLARHGQPLAADLALQKVLTPYGEEPTARLARLGTQPGAGPVLYPLMGALAVLRLRQRAGRPLWWALLPVIALACGQVLEGVLFVTLPRPSPSSLVQGVGSSFSSGHATAATLGWGLVAVALSSSRQRGRRLESGTAVLGRGTCLAATGAGLLVGATRIALGFHWVSDVLAAVALGVLLLVVTCTVDRLVAPTATAKRAATRPTSRPLSSPWWWLVPTAAAMLPLVSLLLTPATERLKDLLVYQGAGGAAGAGVDVYGFRTVFHMPFTYPPFAALLSEPLSRLPVGLGQVLWIAATLGALVMLANIALAPVVGRFGLPLTVAAMLVAAPVRSHLRFGQVGVFLTLLVALDLLRPEPQGRTRGLGLGLAIAIKLTPVVFLPWLAVTRLWARLRATLAWLVVATVLGLLLLWRSASDYVLAASRDTTRFGANDIPGNQSIRAMLLRSDLPDSLVQPLWLAVSLLLLIAATYGARRLERDGLRLAAVSVLACLAVAVSPISWVHHLVWLFLPIAALAASGRWTLAGIWYVVLIPGLPALGAAGVRAGPGPVLLWQLVIDLQGLTAIAAVLLLPSLCRPAGSTAPSGERSAP